MLAFWLPAAVLALAAALLVMQRAASASRQAARGREPPELELHRRQLADLDAQVRRGLLGEAEHAAARAEAGRRLLSAASRPRAAERAGGRGARLASLAVAGAAAMVALGLYLALGSPGRPDQPYAQRLGQWRRADPASLDPARMAAVLAAIAETRPGDPQVFDYLGRAQLAAGAPGEAARAFARAARLAPMQADLPAEEGEALVLGAGGKVEPPAEAAFREALRRDPKNAAARFHLARLRMARGDVAGGLADWRALQADLPADDPRRAALGVEIARASSSPPPVSGPSPAEVAAAAGGVPAPGPEQAAFIRAMVDRLAARLKAQPDDPDGWARLVRAYRVLGDRSAEAQALARARSLYAGQPATLARIEAER
jgi:cytochrome c-type biogenesis protein CcmH